MSTYNSVDQRPETRGNLSNPATFHEISLGQTGQYWVDASGNTFDTTQVRDLVVSTITNPAGDTFRYNLSGSPDLSDIYAGGMIEFTGTEDENNSGRFIVTAVSDGSDYIEVSNENGVVQAAAAGSGIYKAFPKGYVVKFLETSTVTTLTIDEQYGATTARSFTAGSTIEGMIEKLVLADGSAIVYFRP